MKAASTEERKFIRQAVVAWMPLLDWDYEKACRYAERAWKRLQDQGYGNRDKGPVRPNPLEDHYRCLTPAQRSCFDLFWDAYDHKVGKSRAAMRFGQLGDLSENQYKIIVDAARADARRQRPEGAVRKMPEGWLAERRWEDMSTQTSVKRTNKARLRELLGEHRALVTLRDSADDQAQKDALNVSIRKIQESISKEEAITEGE